MSFNKLMRVRQTDLIAGDVLVCRPAKHVGFAAAIKKISNSPYTHAAIYLGRGLVAESTFPTGVCITSLQTIVHRYAHVAVLRHPDAFTFHRPARLALFIQSLISRGAGYAAYKAATIGFTTSKIKSSLDIVREHHEAGNAPIKWKSKNYFCSQLVVAALIDVGFIHSSAVVVYQPRSFYPGDFFSDRTFGFSVGYLSSRTLIALPEDDPLRRVDSFEIFR